MQTPPPSSGAGWPRFDHWVRRWAGCFNGPQRDELLEGPHAQTLIALWGLENEVARLEAGAFTEAPVPGSDGGRPDARYPDLRRLVRHLDCRPLVETIAETADRDRNEILTAIAANQTRRVEAVETATVTCSRQVRGQALAMAIDVAVSKARWIVHHDGPGYLADNQAALHWLGLVGRHADPEQARAEVLAAHQLDTNRPDARLTHLERAANLVGGGRIDPRPALYAATLTGGPKVRIHDSGRDALIIHGAVARRGELLLGILPRAVTTWIEQTRGVGSATRAETLRTDPQATSSWQPEHWDTALVLWPEFGVGAPAAEKALAAAARL